MRRRRKRGGKEWKEGGVGGSKFEAGCVGKRKKEGYI